MPSDSTLTLYIPDLFGFQSTFSKLSKDELSQLPEIKLPVLEKWLSRGSVLESNFLNDPVLTEFGLSIKSNTDKHYAALSLFAEDISDIDITKKAYWLRADPVNLQPDRDTALLTANEELSLTQEEANKLVEQINNHFIDEPWQLYAFAPHRWYLRLDNPVSLQTHSLFNVLGEDINQFMPSGDDADYWFNITNEIQMLLHGSTVNFERESRNRLTANSIWLWGGGGFPVFDKKSSYDRIITNSILFAGIGHYCGYKVLPLEDNVLNKLEQGNNFIVLDMLSKYVHRRDLYGFTKKLNEMEIVFFTQFNQLLESGGVDKIKLLTNAGQTITITAKQLRRWWKRIKSFSGFKNA